MWHRGPTCSERRTTVVGIIFKLALPDRGTTRGCECDWCHWTILLCRIKKGWFSFSDSEHTEGGLVEVFRTGYSCFCYFLFGSEKNGLYCGIPEQKTLCWLYVVQPVLLFLSGMHGTEQVPNSPPCVLRLQEVHSGTVVVRATTSLCGG